MKSTKDSLLEDIKAEFAEVNAMMEALEAKEPEDEASEAYDKWIGPGTPEMADVTLTWFGGLGAMFLILIIDLFRTDKY